ANAFAAAEAGLDMILVINKIDLPGARPEDIALEAEQVLGLDSSEAVFTSGKTGAGLDELFKAIIEKIRPPSGDPSGKLKALIYDAKPDVHRGVICHTRVFDGSFKRGDKIELMAAGRNFIITEVGKYSPKPAA